MSVQTGPIDPASAATPRPRIAFVTIGQTPREDVLPDILGRLPMPVDADEFGALDGLESADMADLKPRENDLCLHTRLRDGSAVVVRQSAIEKRVAAIVADTDYRGYDLIVIGTTGLFRDLTAQTPIVHGQRSVDSWIDALILADQRIGVIYPLERQLREARFVHGTAIRHLATGALQGNDDRIDVAARRLTDCHLVVMHSVAYTEETAREVAQLTGRPVVTVRSILASAIRTQIEAVGGPPEWDPAMIEGRLAAALPDLTPREREVIAHVIDGRSNKEIGRLLGISYRTVEIHRGRAMEKLGVSTVSGLIRQVFMIGRR